MKELVVKSLTDNLDDVIEFVDKELEGCACSAKTLTQINVAVEELFVNIAHYAYGDETGLATIRVELSEDRNAVMITFIDSGKPYDPLAKPDPDTTLSVEERQIGGLGIFMVKKSMDDVIYEYREGKNILTLKKVW